MKIRNPSLQRPRRAGFTLLEVVIAMTILIVSMGGMLSSMLASEKLGQTNEERQLAIHAAEGMIETLQGQDFNALFTTFDGRTFEVPGLDPQPGAMVPGRIDFPGTGGVLREDVSDAGLGMPRDLNADGVIDGLDHSGDYTLLPVRIQVAWRGKAGDAQVELQTYLFDLD